MEEQLEYNKPRVDLSSTPWQGCEGNNFIFDSVTMLKRVSPLLSPSGKEEYASAEVLICKKCGKIPPFYADKMPDCPADLQSACKK